MTQARTSLVPESSARICVLSQFILAAAIALSTSWRTVPALLPAVLAGSMIFMGMGLAIWAWLVMGIRQLRVMPQPAKTARLLMHGPYRLVRHPMYGGLIMAAAGCLVWDWSPLRTGLWLGLIVVLEVKTRLEERLLAARFEEYAAYQQRAWRFFPWVR